ncbi:efflux transporter outer membrane subunit [Paludibaculum fermentans]|uniref:Efflux transporter outer membrane subunit n=1 Tax=Paludibaculum fermentans TaxID=1473598 RepID=A0A7S7NQP4_PALFE|nr:efflux transporter outer membrane subunit [Paludibaculum fermentans]QOY88017.1 efflux transporter outer membrane subunit [Paludibaculum fermentans]
MDRRILLVSLAVALGGCVHNRPYERPPSPVPAALPHAQAAEPVPAGASQAADIPWRAFFPDSRLQTVIETALANNRDLKMAALNIERAEALYRIQSAQQRPTVAASASGSLYRLPKDMSVAGINVGQAVTIQQYTLNLGAASWELDLFGRIRSLKAAALEQFLATQQARSATQIALVAGVAGTYLALAADQENLRLARSTLEAQQASYDLIRQIRDSGMGSDLDLFQAQSQVEAARVDIARYSGQVELDGHALALLVGAPVPPGLQPSELGPGSAMKEIAAELPSEVLLQRPDILMAEHQLKAAHASIGAARAAYFPRISLTAGGGSMSSDLTKLFNAGAGTWNFAPQISLPIFDSGARKSTVKVAETDRALAVAEYDKAIQTAFREVSDALSQRDSLRSQLVAQKILVTSLEQTYRIAGVRYQAGMDSYLTVLVAQRTLYQGQQGLVSLRLAQLANQVALYKAMGGGA